MSHSDPPAREASDGTDASSVTAVPETSLDRLLRLSKPAALSTLLAAVLIGVAFDLMLRAERVGISTTIFFCATAAAIAWVAVPRRSRSLVVALAAVPVFAACLTLRSSPWLVPFDILAIVALLFIAASFARGGSPFSVTVPAIALRLVTALPQGILAVSFAVDPLRPLFTRENQKAIPIVRGVLLAAPVIALLVVLLASADAVFASLFDWNIGVDAAFGHVVLIVVGAWLFAVVARIAMCESPTNEPEVGFRIGPIEGLITVGSLVVVFAVFVVSQLIVWSGGASHVLDTAGLSYAEHAREGFFQLLAVAFITLVVLMSARATTSLPTDAHRRWFRVFAIAAVVLTLAIVALALRRLALYEDAYGLTMLRLYSTVFAGWIAVVFVIFGVVLFRSHKGHWFIGSAASVALVILLALNAVNPEALVVDRNVDRQVQGTAVPLDADYIGDLSADAVPTVIASLDTLDPTQRSIALGKVCNQLDDTKDWDSWNWSHQQAADAAKPHCDSRISGADR